METTTKTETRDCDFVFLRTVMSQVAREKSRQIQEFEQQHLEKVGTHELATYPETMRFTDEGALFEQVLVIRPKKSVDVLSREQAMDRYPFTILRWTTPTMRAKV